MRIFNDLSEIRGQIPNPAVAVGSFDGVHAGHREIIRSLNEAAASLKGESVVVTFDPHPRQVIHPEDDGLRLLNSLEEKIYLLDRAGVDNLFIIPFTPEFRSLSSEQFARAYLLEGIGAKTLVMGYNHHFGRDREGDRSYLEELRREFGFGVVQLPKFEVVDHKVSSTVIRFLVRSGELRSARELLCEPYFFIGRTGVCGLVDYDEPAKLFPPDGVYPVSVESGRVAFDTNLVIMQGKLGVPFPVKAQCESGQKLIVRFRDPVRDAERE